MAIFKDLAEKSNLLGQIYYIHIHREVNDSIKNVPIFKKWLNMQFQILTVY